MQKGLIFNVQRFSTEDGPGIRTTVFFKGCPLRCVWCQNPEGLEPYPEIIWYDERCIGCGQCSKACPRNAITFFDEGVKTDRKLCINCGKCAETCPSRARELIGVYMTVDELLAEVERDEIFYETSGGGITASGGEPMMQPSFLLEFFMKCKEIGLHISLDTCGCAKWEAFERILPNLDLILYDLKLIDPDKHFLYTGVSPNLILENLKKIDAFGIPIWIRTPVVPGYTAHEQNIKNIAELISGLKCIERYDLLPYHRLGEPKYKKLGKNYFLIGLNQPSEEYMQRLARIAESYGLKSITY